MEGTTNYLIPGYASFTNITNVEMVPYSSDDSADPEQAIIIGTDRVAIDFTKGTSKNILTSFELKLDEMIYSNTQLNESEAKTAQIMQNLILVHRSNFYIDNMELGNDYKDLQTNIVWFLAVYLQDLTITIKNIQWNLHGRILNSVDPLNLYMENIVVDYVKGYGGVRIRPDCNYPEASYFAALNVKNITFYYSGERQIPVVLQALIESSGSGDFIIDHYYSYTYIYEHELESQVGVQAIEHCMPDIEENRYFNITNADFNMPVQDGRATNVISSTVEEERYRVSVLYYENITINDHLEGLYPALHAAATVNDIFIYRNIYFNSTSNYFSILFVATANEIIMENIFFEKAD